LGAKVAIVACDSYNRPDIEAAVEQAVDLLGGMARFIRPGERVLVKPNLCLAEPPEKSITTHPEIVRKIALMGNEAGAQVIVGDNPVGDADRSRLNKIWERTGVGVILEGIRCERSFLDRGMTVFTSRIKEQDYSYYLSKELFDLDLIINVPKFKTHSLMAFTGAVKNLYGLLPGNSKKKLHSELPVHEDFATLLADVYHLIRPGLNIMDAVIGIEGDGPGAQGTCRKIGLIMASDDGFALDSVAARLMNLEPSFILTNRIGGAKGFGEIDMQQIEILGEPLAKYIMEDFKMPATSRYRPDLTHLLFNLARAYIKILPETCKACGLCVPNCPADSIQILDGTALIDQKTCISCMTCHEICPEGAVWAERSAFYKQLKQLKNKKATIKGEGN
jgi:uncharacterized protein (DUF362 family)/NAD-dependent dihydropyrimidine dehydrogenase PreA subunit